MKLLGLLVLAISVVAVVVADARSELIAGTRTFAARLYTELITTKWNQNVIFSPLTVQTVMSLLASASDNENEEVIQEIRDTLSLPYGKTNRDEAFRLVLEDLNKKDNDFKVFDATKMYFKSGYTPDPTYQDNAEYYYRSEVDSVNFGNPRQTSQDINEWVKKKTNNKITDLISQYDISRNTQNLMINTLYLQGKWTKPFLAKDTVNRIFKSPNGHKSVPMMSTKTFTYNYYEDTDAQYLQLEILRAEDAYMVIVLPKQEQGLANLEGNIHRFIQDVNFEITQVNVTLPKFSFSDNMKLKSTLKNIGVKKLFQWGAQLKGLNYPGHPFIIITEVAQKAVVEVSEWGVTAGSVSTGKVTVDATNNEPKTFIADHPFFFYITVDDAVVFTGRVMTI